MLTPGLSDYCRLDEQERPKLIVVVDTEEEFDWFATRSRENTSISALRHIDRAQKIFDSYRVTPVYVIDYPVASQTEGFQPLKEIYQSGRCLIGAHLHPWVNPPFVEQSSLKNSFPGNLPRAVEEAKLRALGDCIEANFGARPIIYKAGRYGIGPNTAEILEEQGYAIDVSVCPQMNYSAEGGPDFSNLSARPYWFGNRRQLLELPLTVGFAGLLRYWGGALHNVASRPFLATVHAVGLLARLRLIDRIWLSPEGYRFSEQQRLVRSLVRDGLRVFSFAFHSPSLQSGHTPYVRSCEDLQKFLSRCRRFFDFFMGDLGGQPTTPIELREYLLQAICRETVKAKRSGTG